MTQIDTRPDAASGAGPDALPAERNFPNFFGTHPVTVDCSKASGFMPHRVRLTQCSGSMTLHHAMTTEQAREMGRFLIECADALEAGK